MRIYLDNAATTALDPRVLEAMLSYLSANYGNPSSLYKEGREARSVVEKARKLVANIFGCAPAELFFTSGGTESDNTTLKSVVEAGGITHIISSPLEHHAVLDTVEYLSEKHGINLTQLNVDSEGRLDYTQLEELLAKYKDATLVSLMHGNNEIGNLLEIERVAELCQNYGSFFHSDMVQTAGHYEIDFSKLSVDSAAFSGHKFHGPKGTGFLYSRNQKQKVSSLIHGGTQERNMRAGTENVAGIVGAVKALEIACHNRTEHQSSIEKIKKYTLDKLRQIDNIGFHGLSDSMTESLYTVINIALPKDIDTAMLGFNLDIQGISVSGGSACTSGALGGSHVINALGVDTKPIRISFSKHTTTEEIDVFVEKLKAQLD